MVVGIIKAEFRNRDMNCSKAQFPATAIDLYIVPIRPKDRPTFGTEAGRLSLNLLDPRFAMKAGRTFADRSDLNNCPALARRTDQIR